MTFAFSRRLPADLSESPLQQALHAATDCIDLTESNPTRCGFAYPEVLEPLLGPRTWRYTPDAQGMAETRALLASALAENDRMVHPDNLLLTASTSEAYAMVLKLLCDPGDRVAVGAPSYPLVQHLAELEAVGTLSYLWEYSGGRWRLDFDSITHLLNEGVKAFVLIAPNNPTGSCPRPDELQELATLCNRHGTPLIVDEVFAPYRTDASPGGFPYGAFERCIVLDGLSKAAALPQLKLGWMALHGDAAWVAAARERLTWIADTYLSVATPVQVALAALLKAAPRLRQQIRARLDENRQRLTRLLDRVPTVDLLPSDGGWYAVLRVPQRLTEDALVLTLAQQAQVKVHPGYFYDFPSNGYLVVGLLNPSDPFGAAAERVTACLHHLFSVE